MSFAQASWSGKTRVLTCLILFFGGVTGCHGGSGGPIGGGPGADCSGVVGPRLNFVSPSGDGTLFVGGTFPRTDAKGKPLTYKAVVTKAGFPGTTTIPNVPVVFNNGTGTAGHVDIPAIKNNAGQDVPWSSGDTVQISSGCGSDTAGLP